MDRYQAILESIAGLNERLSEAGVEGWLKAQPTVIVEGRRYFVLAGDRFADEAEAKLFFAVEQGLVSDEQITAASADVPLPPDVETVEIETEDPGDP